MGIFRVGDFLIPLKFKVKFLYVPSYQVFPGNNLSKGKNMPNINKRHDTKPHLNLLVVTNRANIHQFKVKN